MNRLLAIGYEAAGQIARGLAAIAPEREGKLWRSLGARRGIRARYAAWSRAGRDPSRPLLWMHAPSVGEGLQARPVLERLRAERPDVQLAYTHFSPSAAAFARGLDVDFRDFLPFDTAGDADAALDALRPTALVFSKLDVWPTLATRARRRGVRLGLISATLSAASSRRSGVAGALLREAYGALDLVGAIDEGDAARLIALGVPADRVRVTGDTRYDQVWARAASADRGGALLAPLASDRPTLVAGSTWPADEAVLLDAWSAARRRVSDARLIIAPHEPTASHLAPIERWARDAGVQLARLGAPTQATADVILVDRVGVLGDLYALADVAFVGGGFHAAGLHSVLEPAAFGAPVLFGPRHEGSRDAGLLLAAGGAKAPATTAEMTGALEALLGNVDTRRAAGDAAHDVAERGLGAAERSTTLVEELLDAGRSGLPRGGAGTDE